MIADTELQKYDYIYPRLSRAGLGNLLFPWAHAVVLAERSDTPLLPPRWFKVRLGPILRRDVDTRQYQRIFRRPPLREVLRRVLLLRTATLWSETGELLKRGSQTQVLVVSSMDARFAPLGGHREVIMRRLLEAARPEVVEGLPRPGSYIALHVRRGDFRFADEEPARVGLATPLARAQGWEAASGVLVASRIEWFCDAVMAARAVGWDGPALVCSDGTDEQLAPLATLPGVVVRRGTNAMQDLLTLANARVVIGSGSSFSAWGSFLGSLPLFVERSDGHFDPSGVPVRHFDSWRPEAARAALARALDGNGSSSNLPTP